MSKGNRKCACGLVPALCKENCTPTIKSGVDCHAESLAAQIAGTGQVTFPDDRTKREIVLDDAWQAVSNDRNTEYGEPIDNLGRWAKAMNALGYRGPGGRELRPHDMAVIMGLGKLARSVESYAKADTWVDLAGYAAIGYECVTLEDQ